MSKIGELPIEVKQGIELQIKNNEVFVSGTHGKMTVKIPKNIEIDRQDNMIYVKRKRNNSKTKALHGLIRTLINNAVVGVASPWKKTLEVIGTGYRAKMQGEDIIFEVGYSHPVLFKKKEGIALTVEGKNKVIVSGVDRHLVGEIAKQIKLIKKPDPYKGKGIRYEGEYIKLKPGKKAKGATGE